MMERPSRARLLKHAVTTGGARPFAAILAGLVLGMGIAFIGWAVLRAPGDPRDVYLGYGDLGKHYATKFLPIQHRSYITFDPALFEGAAPARRFAFGFARRVEARWRMTAVGDVMAHDSLQITAYTHRDAPGEKAGGYDHLLAAAGPAIREAGLSVGNLETVVTPDLPRRGFPTFNADPAYLRALAGIGFDVMTTANNHILDFGTDGLAATERALAANGLAFTGTSAAPRMGIIAEVAPADGGAPLKLGIVAYTDYVNGGIRQHTLGAGSLAQVNYVCAGRHWVARAFVDWLVPAACHTSEASFLADAKAAIAALRAQGADYVAVFLHRLRAYAFFPNEGERRQAEALAERGADATINTGAHTIMPVERIYTRNGAVVDAAGLGTREHLVVYSLGNFISTQGGAAAYGLVARIDIGRTADGRFVHAVSPLFVKSELTLEEVTEPHPNGVARTRKIEILRLRVLEWLAFAREARALLAIP